MLTSTRRGIVYPNTDRSDTPDIPRDIAVLVAALELDVLYVQGTNAARLAAAHYPSGGRVWWTTDTLVWWYDDGTTWRPITTSQLTYDAITSPVTVTNVVEASAVTCITGSSFTADGTDVMIEAYCPDLHGNQAPITFIVLNDSGTSLGWAKTSSYGGGGGASGAVSWKGRDTPAAGTRHYVVKAFQTAAGGGSGTFNAGAGGSGAFAPAYLRVVKA